MKISILYAFFTFFIVVEAFGQWKDVFSYKNVVNVCRSSDYYLAQCERGILLMDKQNGEISKLSTVNQLSNAVVTATSAYDNGFVVGYNDGNIDILQNLRAKNINAIYITTKHNDKKINDINILQNKILTSTNSGIYCLDANDGDILWHCETPSQVLSGVLVENFAYFTDGKTVYKKNINDINIQDFSTWQTFFSVDGEITIDKILQINGNIFLNIYDNDKNVTNIYSINTQKNIFSFDGKVETKVSNNLFSAVYSKKCIFFDVDGNIVETINLDVFNTNCPQTNNIYKIANCKNTFAIIENNRNQISVYDNGFWSFIPNDENVDYQDVLINPYNENHIFAATTNGLHEYINHNLKATYNADNSPLTSLKINALSTTTSGYIHVADSSNCPIKIFAPDANWYQMPESENIAYKIVKQILIYNDRYIFIIFDNKNEIFLIDNNKTPINFSDDKSVLFNLTTNDGSQISYINSLTIGTDNYVWAATNSGCAYCINVEDIFNGNYSFSRPLLSDEQLPEFSHYLLKKQDVSKIIPDYEGNYWISTRGNGIFKLNNQCNTELQHFSTQNSPLPSNIINDIAINDNGFLLINSNLGLIIYKSDVQKPAESLSNIKIFPNPVDIKNINEITIENLEQQTFITITTFSGKIVYKTESAAGSVKIKLPNLTCGIYLVVCQNAISNDKKILKLAIK